MLERLKKQLWRWIAPKMRNPLPLGRMYSAARNSRLTAGWQTSNTSADSELVSSLVQLRSRSRALVRDAAYAKRAKIIVVNNVVGPGIGMQAQVGTTRGALNDRVNDDIESAWTRWSKADSCHTGGALHFADFERALMGQVFEAGEVLVRKHYRQFGASTIPFSLELIEAERLADEFQNPFPGPVSPGAVVRMGIEQDDFYRPIAYWLRNKHPGELRLNAENTSKLERVPAEQIIHIRIVDRWPQTRGEPWLHAVARKLNDMDGYSEAEITAARGAASYMGVIQTPDAERDFGEIQEDGTEQLEISPGLIEKLGPGETFNFVAPNRPNANLDPFMRYMLREVAAGCGCSYESLSRDYSQSNYSSSRLALLDDRDLWKTLQQWFIRSFRDQIHREWLQQAILARAITNIRVDEYVASPEKFEAVSFKPRGWSWVDPTKEVEAFKEARKAGFISTTSIIAATANGQDVEDVINEIKRENALFAAAGIKVDTDVPDMPVQAPVANPGPNAGQKFDVHVHNANPIVHMKPPNVTVEATRITMPPAHVTVESPTIKLGETVINIPQQKAPQVSIENRYENRYDMPSPVVNVTGSMIENKIDIPAPVVNVTGSKVENRFDMPSPVVNVTGSTIENKIDIPAPQVSVENRIEGSQVNIENRMPQVNVENRVDVPPTIVNMPNIEIPENHIPAPQITIENKIELPEPQFDTEKIPVRGENGEIIKVIENRMDKRKEMTIEKIPVRNERGEIIKVIERRA